MSTDAVRGLNHGATVNTLRDAIRRMAWPRNQKESVMIKLGKVSVETRGSKQIVPQEIQNVLFTQF
jgi:hypothetical protein